MQSGERLQMIALIKARIAQLDVELSESESHSEKSRSQDDAAAKLDLTINTPIDEKLISAHRAERRQLTHNLNWINSEEAGLCEQCGCNIPIERLKAVLDTRLCVVCAENSSQ